MTSITKSALKFLNRFPKGIDFAFLYGSRLSQQPVNVDSTASRQIDIILAVNNVSRFHSENLLSNYKDYSSIRYFGSSAIVGPNGQMFKYGVIGFNDLIDDLMNWKSMYTNYRLHKPVLALTINPEIKSKLVQALLQNLQYALHLSLLQLPRSFSETDLYFKIIELSYLGDFRMIIGERKDKPRVISERNRTEMKTLYKPLLIDDNRLSLSEQNGDLHFVQDQSKMTKLYRLNCLPASLQIYICKQNLKKGTHRNLDVKEMLKLLVDQGNLTEVIRKSLYHINMKVSVAQALKGVLTAELKPMPAEVFDPVKVEQVMQDYLKEKLSKVKYDPEVCTNLSKQMVDELKQRVKAMGYERYKLVVHLIIGQKDPQADNLQMAARCFWDAETDGLAHCHFVSDEIFCAALVFASYFY
ncbi:hypothetical protein GJ496_005441 [Pomphorhynchus laevis]|nr:hypothetical protein GJ496_005441 [Pomphorhynchus laevis]